jgi:hypothetical protein
VEDVKKMEDVEKRKERRKNRWKMWLDGRCREHGRWNIKR